MQNLESLPIFGSLLDCLIITIGDTLHKGGRRNFLSHQTGSVMCFYTLCF